MILVRKKKSLQVKKDFKMILSNRTKFVHARIFNLKKPTFYFIPVLEDTLFLYLDPKIKIREKFNFLNFLGNCLKDKANDLGKQQRNFTVYFGNK